MRKNHDDPRINAHHPVWVEYIVIWFVMCCLTGGQAMIFYSYVEVPHSIPISFVFANIGYWGLMSLVFASITLTMRRKTWERPLQKLSEAAKQVAEGDFSVHLDPLRKDGKKDYVEVMLEDFNKMVDELGSIETLTADFISNVSHEIKTPLSVIQSYAAALQKPNLPEDTRREYTDTIIVASSKLNTLVTNILKLGKLENQAIKPNLSEFDITGQLAECAVIFEEQLNEKSIQFSIETDDRCVICADKELLSIVWDNLLGNAIKFTEKGGAVKLIQTSESDSITVTVSDTGCGMDDVTLHRVFDKFYQGDISHSDEGSGLGLALAGRVVELLGGQITAKSELSKGSEFSVSLPIAANNESQARYLRLEKSE